jgi:signal transduction histidine kinase
LKNIIFYFIAFSFFVSCSKDGAFDNDYKLDYFFDQVYSDNLEKDIKLSYLDSARVIVSMQDNLDSTKITNTFKIANRLYTLLEFNDYLEVSREALRLSKLQKDSLGFAKAEYYIGDYYFFTSRNDSAYYYYLEAKKKYDRLNDDFNHAKTMLHIAYVHLYERDFLGSEAQTIKVLDIAKRINDQGLIYECYVNLGSSLLGLKNYEKALEYNFKALNQIKYLDEDVYSVLYEPQVLNNIGYVYINLNDYEKALEFYSRALQVENFSELHPILYSSLLDYLSYTKFKLKDKEALFGFQKSMRIRDSINDTAGKIKSRIHLTEYYLSQKDTNKALALNMEAYQLAKESNYNKEVLSALEFLTLTDPTHGLKYAQEYIVLSDSLNDMERATRNKLARIEYETDEIIQEKQEVVNQNQLLIIISLIVLLMGVLFYVFLNQRNKQRELILKQDQQKANEEIYNLMLDQQTKISEVRNAEKDRIAKELHDGVMNKLASTRLNLFILQKRRDDATIEKCIGHINDIQNIEKEVRSIAHELNNEIFSDKNNFDSILEELIAQQNKVHSSFCRLFVSENINWENIEAKVKMNLYRVIQEALNNINKHASANNVFIEISLEKGELKMVVKDDGKGFNVSRSRRGIGVKNMIERAKAINGVLSIDSKIGKGTALTLKIVV